MVKFSKFDQNADQTADQRFHRIHHQMVHIKDFKKKKPYRNCEIVRRIEQEIKMVRWRENASIKMSLKW